MLSLVKEISALVIQEVLSPAVIRTGDLDGTLSEIKRAVTRSIRERGAAPEVLALHFARSQRSIYRYMDLMPTENRQGEDKGEPTLAETLVGYCGSSEDGKSAESCARYIRRRYPQLSMNEVEGLLDLYARTGLLRRIDAPDTEGASTRYTAVFKTKSRRRTEALLATLRRQMKSIFPLALSVAMEEETSASLLLKGTLPTNVAMAALRDIRCYAVKRWEEAKAEASGSRQDASSLYTLVLFAGSPQHETDAGAPLGSDDGDHLPLRKTVRYEAPALRC